MVFSWPNKELCTIDHFHVSPNQTGNTHRKSRKNDNNSYKNQVFAAKTILNYLGTGNREFIRCSVLFAVCEITKQQDFNSIFLSRTTKILTHLARKFNCRSFGQTHRSSSSLANSPMSYSFLEEDQLSRANIKSERRENLASSSSLDSLRVK